MRPSTRPSKPAIPSRRQFLAFSTLASAAALAAQPAAAAVISGAADDEGISHAAESIHLEASLKASPERVYAALTEAWRFDEVARRSAAMKSMSLAKKPSQIGRTPGAAFAIFGGYVIGLQVELVPNLRIVQVWRSQGWSPGEYSMVRFELAADGGATKLALDHRGFPQGQAQHLVDGWKGNYLEPLASYLGQQG